MAFKYRVRDLIRSCDPRLLAPNIRYTRSNTIEWRVPPARYRVVAIASANLSWYIEYGRRTAEAIRNLMRQHACDLSDREKMLDFGCGTGRVLRHFSDDAAREIWGADINPRLISWCKRNLPFAHFLPKCQLPALQCRANNFDFVYALSVFTHITESTERLWLDEIRRILAPGGYFLVTLRGDRYHSKLDNSERISYNAGNLVVRRPKYCGRNECDSYHPQPYILNTYGSRFEIITRIESPSDFQPRPFVPNADPGQDVWLMRRPI